MKRFLALPAVLRLAVCAHQSFSVNNDILAYPQYEIVYSASLITPSEAEQRLVSVQQRSQYEEPLAEASSDLIKKIHPFSTDGASDYDYGEEDHQQHTYEKLILRGYPYLCAIPIVQNAPDPPKNITKSQEEQNQDLERASSHGIELLSEMQGQCLYYVSGWWTYSFCYNDGVKQYHHLPQQPGAPAFPPVEDENVESYMLGRFLPARKHESAEEQDTHQEPSTQLQTRGETSYLVQKLNGGTECDLTGTDRRIEVQFHCNPLDSDRIAMIKETASCVYLMVIHTPRLCKDVAFMPPQEEKPAPITCQQIVKEDDISAWRAIKAVQAEKELFDKDIKLNSYKPIIVGGIEVGGKVLVGKSSNTKIEPGNIVGGQQKSKLLARIATFDGEKLWKISEKELEKLGLKGGLAIVDKWIDKLKRDEPWRLDIIEKPSGREFVVVFGSHLDDEERDDDGRIAGATTKKKNEDPDVGVERDDEDLPEGSKEEYKEEL